MKRNHKARLFSTILALTMMFGLGSQASQNVVKANAEAYPKAASNVTTTVTCNELEIYTGTLENLVDGNDETYCWFKAPTRNVSFVQLNFSEPIAIYDVRILFDTHIDDNASPADRIIGDLSYSEDGTTFTNISRIDKNEQLVKLETPATQVKHLRLLSTENDGLSWVKMYDFSYNCGRPYISYNGFTFVTEYWNSVNNMTDNNLDTYTWFDWKNSAGADITLSFEDIKEVRNIYILTSHPRTGDHFQKMSLYYSLDGNNFTLAGEDCYVEQKEVLIELPTPVQAKYIRVVCPEQQNMGFAIREFGINHEKVAAPITFSNTTPYTYTSEAITPTYTIPFLTEAEVHYTYHEEFYSNDAPTKPGWYALVVKVKESAYYSETSKFSVFCIRDTKEHFVSEWTLAMNNGVCDLATNSEKKANYDYLLEVYKDCMTDELRNEINNYQWSDDSTIQETMQYIEMLNTAANDQTNANAEYFINSIHNTNPLIIVILGLGLIATVTYYLLNKKRAR